MLGASTCPYRLLFRFSIIVGWLNHGTPNVTSMYTGVISMSALRKCVAKISGIGLEVQDYWKNQHKSKGVPL